jgi:putative MATE family efflux protein
MKKWISIFKAEDRDFTSGSLSKNIWVLAIPMILEMGMQSTFSLIDMFWVGKLGPEAIAAVSMAGILLMVLFSLAIGVSIAGGALVARRVGEGNYDEAGDVIFQAMILSAFLSVFFGIIGWYYTPHMLVLLGAKGEVLTLGVGYLQISFLGCSTLVFLFVINSIFRGAGHALEAMNILGLANIINIAIDPFLIFGWWIFPELGVEGAAYGTVISRGLAVLVQLYFLLRGTLRIPFKRVHLRLHGKVIGLMTLIAIPGSLQLLLRILATLVIMRFVAYYGTYAVAAYGIGLTVFRFVLLPGFGLGNAASTLVGQNLGALAPDRASKSAWYAASYNMLFMGFFAILFLILDKQLVMIFNSHPEVIRLGVKCVRIFCISFVFVGIGIVMQRALMGAGDTMTPMVINAFTLWVVQLPLARYLSNSLEYKTEGIFYAIIIANILGAFIAAAWFKIGRWQHKSI